MVIAHNLAAMNANRMFNINERSNKKVCEKLSSGYRINRSADDAAGLAISEKMRRQIRGLTQASANAQDGISLCQVSDGALTETHDILQRMNELTIQAANGTYTSEDRQAIQVEVEQLKNELDRIAKQTTFNGDIYPLDGGVEFPPSVGSVELTIVNNSTGIVNCDGQSYQPGESFKIDVLAIMKAPDYTTPASSAIYEFYQGGGRGYYSGTSPYVITGDKPQYDVVYSTLDDLKIDDNGYLYTESLSMSNTDYYLGQTQFKSVSNPTTENLEQEGIQKAIDKEQMIHLQVGAESHQWITLFTVNATASSLGVKNVDVSEESGCDSAIEAVKSAIERVSSYRNQFGSVQNRLEHTIANLDNITENTQASESRIRDTDMAEEMVRFSNNNIIAQAGQAMLTQANQQSNMILGLLQ